MKKIRWGNFPLPLIQVNPPPLIKSSFIVTRAYKEGVYTNVGSINLEASDLLASHISPNLKAYLCNNNTLGLVAALMAVNVRGKHVILSNFTFPATFHAINLAGGIPLICDVDTNNYELDLAAVTKLITDQKYQIGAVLPTRIFGFINDLSDLISICRSNSIPVIVDAAGSFPAMKHHWNFNEQATFEVFSLHATKVFGVGEGGLVIGKNEDIAKIKHFGNFGIYQNELSKFEDGLNAKSDEFTSARVIARFEAFKKDVKKRAEFIQIYKHALSNSKKVAAYSYSRNANYSYFPIKFESEEKLLDAQKFLSPFVTTRRYYYPSLSEGYAGNSIYITNGALKVSTTAAKTTLCLPVYVKYSSKVKKQLSRIMLEMLERI